MCTVSLREPEIKTLIKRNERLGREVEKRVFKQ